ncbi:zinc ribbon domain-containing protein [[Arthrobacter] sp. ATCC 21022]|uniref:zinc ribbon domain-containing protein n=1 Tax=[Arthrobacter] sp. ATCC 21022 TaxID=1771959 RepID=UPI0012664C91
MILYDFRCVEGHVFEASLSSMFADDPVCPVCSSAAKRKPPRIGLSGRVDPGPSKEDRPRSWQQVNGGDPETVRAWQRSIEKREKLEERYTELAGDNRPVLAHEGIFSSKPLRVGDEMGTTHGTLRPGSAALRP